MIYYRQFVGRAAGYSLGDMNAMPWDDFLVEVETALVIERNHPR